MKKVGFFNLQNPEAIAEEIILPVVVNIMVGEFAGKLLSKVPLHNNIIKIQHLAIL